MSERIRNYFKVSNGRVEDFVFFSGESGDAKDAFSSAKTLLGRFGRVSVFRAVEGIECHVIGERHG